MSKNKNFSIAKKTKNDEFYTQKSDIEDELLHSDYAPHFRNKVVYLNCDNPEKSEFWKFFINVFDKWGLKKLIATYYNPNNINFSYKLEIIKTNIKPVITPLHCDGDFRSAACIEILKKADIIVTNPPFSLFREYVAQLIKYEKKFLIIGNQNAITYKEFFPLIKNGKIWPGYTFNKTFEFIMPDDYEIKGKAFIDENNKKHGFVPGICWFTNLDIQKRHQPLDLKGNKYYGNEYKYPEYVNYDAIECGRIKDIPEDFYGHIGVPITFIDKYCPEQFEIIGTSRQLGQPMSKIAKKGTYETGGIRFYLSVDDVIRMTGDINHQYDKQYVRLYDRIIIKRH